jgi:hypothetical protein
MRHFPLSYDNHDFANVPRLLAATFAGHILSGVRTVDAASTPVLRAKLAKGLRRVDVPQDAEGRTAFIAKWVQRHQRRLSLGLPASVLVLAMGSAAAAQDGLTDLAAVDGIADVALRADGSVKVTLDNGSTVVIPKESVTVGADGAILVSASAMDSLTAIIASAGASGAALGGSFALAGLGLAAGGGSGGGADSGSGDGGGDETTPVVSSNGRVIDGYIAGATVFRDLNGNGILDAWEPNVETNDEGEFTGLEGSGGVIIAFGGIDISTGKEFTGQLTAPGDATVVTPLTTLVQALVQQGGVTSAQAAQQVAQAFGLGEFDINNTDPVGTDNLAALKAGAQVAAIISVAAAGAGEGGEAAASQAVANSLAGAIASRSVETIGSPLTVEAVQDALQSAAGEDADIASQAAALQAAVQVIAGADTLAEVEQAQTVVQGDLVDAVKDGGTIPDAQAIVAAIENATPLRPTIDSVEVTNINAETATGFTLTGTGRDGTSINIQFGDVTITGAATVEGGTWSYTLTQVPSDGQATLTVTATATIGGTSVTSLPALGQTFTIDTTAPAVPAVALAEDTGTVAGETSNGQVIVSGLEDGSTREYSLDGGENWDDFTGDSFTLTGDAEYSVIVRQTDALGNTSAGSTPLAFTLDTTAPDVPTLEGYETGDVINAAQAALGVTVTGTVEPGATVTLSSGNASFTVTGDETDGSYSFTLYADQLPEDGTYSISATATDGAGNTSEAVTIAGITIDTTAPQAPVIGVVSVDDVIGLDEETVTITGTAEDGASVSVTFDGSTQVVTATGGAFSVIFDTPVEDGPYTITATATDEAGNTGPEGSREITVDLTVPPSAAQLIGSAMTLDEMESALTAFAAEQEGLTIPDGMLSSLAGDALIYRSGQYSLTFDATVFANEDGDEIANGTTLSGTFRFELPLGDFIDHTAGAPNPEAVFQYEQNGIAGNSFNGFMIENLRLGQPSLRMDIDEFNVGPDDEDRDFIIALVGEDALNDLNAAGTITSLQIWLSNVVAPGQDEETGEFFGLNGTEVSINLFRAGSVGLDAFFDDMAANTLRQLQIVQFENGSDFTLATARIDSLDVAFTPGDGYLAADLVAGLNALIALRTAIDTAVDKANDGQLTVSDVQAIVNALQSDDITFAPPFLASEALSQAAVNRLSQFLLDSPQEQQDILNTINSSGNTFANLTELLDSGDSDTDGETPIPIVMHGFSPDFQESLINDEEDAIAAFVQDLIGDPEPDLAGLSNTQLTSDNVIVFNEADLLETLPT